MANYFATTERERRQERDLAVAHNTVAEINAENVLLRAEIARLKKVLERILGEQNYEPDSNIGRYCSKALGIDED